ncbi:hypothetical protein ABEB36_003340 [Hypothenemus hampei]|uniref:Uncharacterized protein n=1 Tax=Hypothenemus hampei TaxID=57062 RepID=A0ABD1F8W0_HYPHA
MERSHCKEEAINFGAYATWHKCNFVRYDLNWLFEVCTLYGRDALKGALWPVGPMHLRPRLTVAGCEIHIAKGNVDMRRAQIEYREINKIQDTLPNEKWRRRLKSNLSTTHKPGSL